MAIVLGGLGLLIARVGGTRAAPRGLARRRRWCAVSVVGSRGRRRRRLRHRHRLCRHGRQPAFLHAADIQGGRWPVSEVELRLTEGVSDPAHDGTDQIKERAHPCADPLSHARRRDRPEPVLVVSHRRLTISTVPRSSPTAPPTSTTSMSSRAPTPPTPCSLHRQPGRRRHLRDDLRPAASSTPSTSLPMATPSRRTSTHSPSWRRLGGTQAYTVPQRGPVRDRHDRYRRPPSRPVARCTRASWTTRSSSTSTASTTSSRSAGR